MKIVVVISITLLLTLIAITALETAHAEALEAQAMVATAQSAQIANAGLTIALIVIGLLSIAVMVLMVIVMTQRYRLNNRPQHPMISQPSSIRGYHQYLPYSQKATLPPAPEHTQIIYFDPQDTEAEEDTFRGWGW